MAEKALKTVQDQLDCSICLETYTDPKLLQCLHVYCHKCLVKLVKNKQGQLSLSCPICRQATPVPANGVAGLQPAFHINRLLELANELKKATTDLPARAERVERATPHNKTKVCCREHAGKEVDLYCLACEKPVCIKCVVIGAKHHGHDCEELVKAFEKYKVEITASLEPMERQLVTIKEALAQLDTRHGEISDQRAAIEADIHEAFRRLHEVLNVRETEVIGQLHQMTQRKLKALAVQRDQIETTLARVGSCVGFMRESLQTGSQGEVLMMKTAVVKQVKELTATFQPDMLEPNTETDMIFSASADTIPACQKYGQILAPGLPDPSKCHATGKGVEVAVVGETSTAVLQAVNYRGEPCREQVLSSECELVSEITGTRTLGSIERRGQSQYEISYQPTIKGRHQLHIKVEGQHIRGSPFSVTAKSPVKNLETPLLTIREVKGPWGVTTSKKGEVVVTEVIGNCVSVFSPSGKKLKSFGSQGSGQGQFSGPTGVAVDGEGNILVVDNGNHRIQKFTSDGQFLAAAGTEGSGYFRLHFPQDIAFNIYNGRLYVTDSNHCVQILNSDLTSCHSFGNKGSGKRQFKFPRGIACDSTGNVYVADYGNHRIQVFTAEGKFLRMFGRHGDGRGELDWPYGIAVDTSGMVYVSEEDSNGIHGVSVFTSIGKFVTSFGSCDSQPGEFWYPHGLCVDSSGVLYVCNSSSDCVQVL